MWPHVVAIVLQTVHGTSFAKKHLKTCKTAKPSTFFIKTWKNTCDLVSHPMVHTCVNFQPICSMFGMVLPVSTTFGYRAIHLIPRFRGLVNTSVNHLHKPMSDILYGI